MSTEVKDAEIVPTNNTQLATFSPTLAEIAKLKETYAPLTADTPEGYDKVRHALAVMVKHRTGVESVRKQLVADALKYQRDINSKAKNLTALLEEIETPLREKRDVVDKAEEAAILAKLKAEDDAKKAKEQAEREAQEALIRAEREKLAQERAKMEEERQKALQEAENVRIQEDAWRKEKQAKIDAENARIYAEQKAARDALEAERKAMAEQARQLEIERAEVRADLDRQEREKREAQEAKERAEFERQAKDKAIQEAHAKFERDRQAAKEQEERDRKEAEAEAKRIEAARPDVEKIHSFGKYLQNNLHGAECKNPEAIAANDQAMSEIKAIGVRLQAFTITKKGSK